MRHAHRRQDGVEDRRAGRVTVREMGVGSPGAVLRGEVASHRKLRRSRAGVVSLTDHPFMAWRTRSQAVTARELHEVRVLQQVDASLEDL